MTVEKYPPEAEHWRQLAEQGNAQAQKELCDSFYSGDVKDKGWNIVATVTVNYGEAVKWGELFMANPARAREPVKMWGDGYLDRYGQEVKPREVAENTWWCHNYRGDVSRQLGLMYASGGEGLTADYEKAVAWLVGWDHFREIFNLLRQRLNDNPDWASAALICKALERETPWLISHAGHVSHDEFVASLGVAIQQQDRALAYLNIELALFAYNTSKSLILIEERLSIDSSSYGSVSLDEAPTLSKIHEKVDSAEGMLADFRARVRMQVQNLSCLLVLCLVLGVLWFVVIKALTFFDILPLAILR